MNTKIMLTIIFSALICSAQAVRGSLVEALQAYNKFLQQYPRIHLNEAEQDYRLAIFIENYQKIQEHNNNSENTYQIGVNRFSDMTQQEFSQKILQNHKIFSSSRSQAISQQVAPKPVIISDSVDWKTKGVVTPVKNQGECGSCWIFSSTGTMESFNAIHNNVLQVSVEQEFLDCTTEANGCYSFGCQGGVPAEAIRYASNYRVKTEAEYPYIGIQGACNITNSTTTKFKPVTFYYLSETSDDLRTALNHGPVSVALDPNNLRDYVSGVFNNCNATAIQIKHAVLAVGYDKNGNWILKNSWANDWGQQGYFLLAPNNNCGVSQV